MFAEYDPVGFTFQVNRFTPGFHSISAVERLDAESAINLPYPYYDTVAPNGNASGGRLARTEVFPERGMSAADIILYRFTCHLPGTDTDGDALSDACDPCPSMSLAVDEDADCALDNSDNCPTTSNQTQTDTDGDSVGDNCDRCPGTDDSIFEADDCSTASLGNTVRCLRR